MRDALSETRLLKLHPKARPYFKAFIEAAEQATGHTFRITQGLRTMAEQAAIYEQGRSLPGMIVSNAKPGQSFHNYGLAVDLCRMDNGKVDWAYNMAELLPYAVDQGIYWGGNFKTPDRPHFEKRMGFTWHQLQAMVSMGKVKDGYVMI